MTVAFMIFYHFGTLLLDLISKMASWKKRKSGFEVSIVATSIPIIVSIIQRLIAICLSPENPENYFWTFCLLNTMKWIVVQKIIVHLTNQHNERKRSYQLNELHEKRRRQHEATQFQKRSKILVNYLERPPNIEKRKQFEICTKRERLDEGVYMKKNPKPNRKVVFSQTFYKRTSTVDENDQMNPSEVQNQDPITHLRCTRI